MDRHFPGKDFKGSQAGMSAMMKTLQKHLTVIIPCVCIHPGNYSGRLGRHHVLRYGCTFFLQLHLLHLPHYSKYTHTHSLKH